MGRAAAMCLAAALGGCGFSGGSAFFEPDAGGDGDGDAGEIDAAVPDAYDCNWSYSPSTGDPCNLTFDPAPSELTDDLDLVIDTTDGEVREDGDVIATLGTTDIGGQTVAVWALDELISGSNIEVVGGPPLLIAVDGVVEFSGVLDLSANDVNGRRAAGSRDAVACGASAGGNGTDDSGGASGGGGGGYGTAGAAGGDSDGDGGGANGGDAGEAEMTPAPLTGGCDGGTGGDGTKNNSGGTGGFGGGAVHIAARASITISGDINAGGTGGDGAEGGEDAGGGGGGSGGYIGLEAPTVDTSGSLAANGGAGGGGTSFNGGNAGPGDSGQLGLVAATGGSGGGMFSADGGAGSFEGTLPETPGQPNGGGGGGGGGLGIIRVLSNGGALGGTISPFATTSAL